MKGSSIHRAGLTKEKMGILLGLTQSESKKQNTRAQLNQHYKTAKTQELDILWGGVQKGIQKVYNVNKTGVQKSPASFLIIGFILGVVFMSLITFIVSISTMAPKTVIKEKAPSAKTSVVSNENQQNEANEGNYVQEKYVVKKGDTINGIAFRFYGKYDEAKIEEILKVNNIYNPGSIQIGQELVIPVIQER